MRSTNVVLYMKYWLDICQSNYSPFINFINAHFNKANTQHIYIHIIWVYLLHMYEYTFNSIIEAYTKMNWTMIHILTSSNITWVTALWCTHCWTTRIKVRSTLVGAFQLVILDMHAHCTCRILVHITHFSLSKLLTYLRSIKWIKNYFYSLWLHKFMV